MRRTPPSLPSRSKSSWESSLRNYCWTNFNFFFWSMHSRRPSGNTILNASRDTPTASTPMSSTRIQKCLPRNSSICKYIYYTVPTILKNLWTSCPPTTSSTNSWWESVPSSRNSSPNGTRNQTLPTKSTLKCSTTSSNASPSSPTETDRKSRIILS